MRLWVLAQELIGHAVFSHATSRASDHVAGAAPRRRVPRRPEQRQREAGDARRRRRRPDGGGAAGASAIRRCCSARSARPSRSPQAPGARRGHRGGRRLRRLHGRRGGGPADRRRRAAHRRGGPPPAARGHRRGRVHRAAARACSVTPAQVQRGKNFVAGVVDRAGEAALGALFTRPDALPTPAELDAPGPVAGADRALGRAAGAVSGRGAGKRRARARRTAGEARTGRDVDQRPTAAAAAARSRVDRDGASPGVARRGAARRWGGTAPAHAPSARPPRWYVAAASERGEPDDHEADAPGDLQQHRDRPRRTPTRTGTASRTGRTRDPGSRPAHRAARSSRTPTGRSTRRG